MSNHVINMMLRAVSPNLRTSEGVLALVTIHACLTIDAQLSTYIPEFDNIHQF